MKPNLDEIEARCKAVTTGEYQGSFVATAQMVLRQDIPAILAYCRELEQQIEALEERIEDERCEALEAVERSEAAYND